MKKPLSIGVPSPCSEKWQNFAPTSAGGFCSSCRKDVTDFTRMTDEEIIHYFAQQPAHTCGRFRPDQLKTYSAVSLPKARPGLALTRAAFVSFLLLLVSKGVSAQTVAPKAKTEVIDQTKKGTDKKSAEKPEHLLKGLIVTKQGKEPLPGTNIVLKGTPSGTVTDAHGRFEFPVKVKAGDVIIVSFVGFATEEYIIPDKAEGPIEITLACTEDITGEVAMNIPYANHQSGLSKLWFKVRRLF